MSQLFTNNASALLVEDLLVAATTVNLGPGDGEQFPLPDGGDPDSFSILSLQDDSGNIEIVKMTERTGDVLTIERGQESTTPAGFATGSRIELRLTAGALSGFKQISDQYDLRGDYIDTDGLRVWHEQDPSTYQFFSVRYYTADVVGIPGLRIQAPPGIDGLSAYFIVNTPDGGTENVGLTPDFNNDAPFPGTGQVMLATPGQITMRTLTGTLGSPRMHATWDYDVPTTSFKYQLAANKTNPVSFEFRPRDEFEVEYTVTINKDGSLKARRAIELESSHQATYTEGTNLQNLFIPDLFVPGTGDWCVWQRDDHNNISRELRYVFNTRYLVSENPTVYDTRATVITPDGNVWLDPDVVIEEDRQVTNKAYVDAKTSGEDLNTLTASVYGGTVLYNNATGIGDAQTATLAGDVTDYQMVEVVGETKGSVNIFYSTHISEDTITNTGASAVWAIVDKPGGGDNGGLGVKFNSGTEIEGYKYGDNAGAFRITKVTGYFPKNPGGV